MALGLAIAIVARRVIRQGRGRVAATTSAAAQQPAFNQIQSDFAAQLPDIPLMEAQDEVEFNGNQVTGWPTKSNPYAAPAIWLQADDGWVADRLAPASK